MGVSVMFKDSLITEIEAGETKTLKSAGKYCEDDIKVSYSSNMRVYEKEFAQSSGWILLTELDEETLSHINDPTFMVVFRNIDEYSYAFYAASSFIVSNTPCGNVNGFSVYGSCDRQNGDTLHSSGVICYPANNAGFEDGLGGMGLFRVTDGKYYLKPGDGFIRAGKYKLIITW